MKEGLKNNLKIIVFIFVLLLLFILIYLCFKMINIDTHDYKSSRFNLKYDTTWQIEEKAPSKLILKHKTSKGTITINYKTLDESLIDVPLKNILNDVIYSINQQNKDYKLLSKNNKDSIYDAYELLYEKKQMQSLVYLFKKDNILLFVTYNDSSQYFDIVIDSVDTIVDSIKINSGEK